MKWFTIFSLFAVFTVASPIEEPPSVSRSAQLEALEALKALVSTRRDDLEIGRNFSCPRTILIYARGSTEPSNMGLFVGPALADRLDNNFGLSGIWVQGIGEPYLANILDNILPAGTTEDAIGEAQRLFELASSKCPGIPIIAGGYSQGATVLSNTIPRLGTDLQNQIKGVVLFGYTRNEQNDGRIPGFPTSKTRVYCEVADLVCLGMLVVTPTHVLYADEAAGPAADFLISQIG